MKDEEFVEEEHEYDPSTEERNVYKKETRNELVENDELSPQEEAFMEGYEEDRSKENPDDDEY